MKRHRVTTWPGDSWSKQGVSFLGLCKLISILMDLSLRLLTPWIIEMSAHRDFQSCNFKWIHLNLDIFRLHKHDCCPVRIHLAHWPLILVAGAVLQSVPLLICVLPLVLRIVKAQEGGRCSSTHMIKIAVHSTEGCRTVLTTIKQKESIHRFCYWWQ